MLSLESADLVVVELRILQQKAAIVIGKCHPELEFDGCYVGFCHGFLYVIYYQAELCCSLISLVGRLYVGGPGLPLSGLRIVPRPGQLAVLQ